MSVAKRPLLAAFLALSALCAIPAARAGDNAVAGARLSVWTPDQWTAKANGDRLEANNPGETVYVVATRLAGAAAAAKDRVHDFIDNELDEADFAADGLSGTAQDGDDDLEFAATTVVDGADVVVLLIYGDPDVMKQQGPRQAVERIRASLKAR
jgi:hypothetical protein